MRLIIYGDFNCPYSYLASQRADALVRLGRVDVDWRAVEHDPRLPLTGTPSCAEPGAWERELAEVAALALPAEEAPVAPPPVVSNTLAAVSAYAEAITDGVQDDVRRAIFEAIWMRRRHLSSAYDVRAIVTAITYPPYPILPYLSSELPPPGYGDPSPTGLTRMFGGTIAANGIPLTTTGWRRARQWGREWLALPGRVVPTVIHTDGTALPGVSGLAYLASLFTHPATGTLPAAARQTPAVATTRAA